MWQRLSQTATMRSSITAHVSRAESKRFEALVAERKAPAKVVWRAEIILATADGLGTMPPDKALGWSPQYDYAAGSSAPFGLACLRQDGATIYAITGTA